MAASLEHETKVLARAMDFFQSRIQQELTSFEQHINEQIEETDQQLQFALAEVSSRIEEIAESTKLQLNATESELDEAIKAAELALSSGQQGLNTASSAPNPSLESFQQALHSANTQLESLYEETVGQLRSIKDQAVEYMHTQIAVYGPWMEQYTQERETAREELSKQLGYQ